MMFFGGVAIKGDTSGWTFHHGKRCQPSFKMNATNITEAKAECLGDQSCYMFYQACNYLEQTSSFPSTTSQHTGSFPSTTPTHTSSLPSTTSPHTSSFPSTTPPQTSSFPSTTPKHTSSFPSTTPPQTIKEFYKCNDSDDETQYNEASNCKLYKKGNIGHIYIYIYIYV